MWRERKGEIGSNVVDRDLFLFPSPPSAPLYSPYLGTLVQPTLDFKNSPIFAFLRNRAPSFDSGYFKAFGLMAVGLDVFSELFK